jgi:hypothetical protein
MGRFDALTHIDQLPEKHEQPQRTPSPSRKEPVQETETSKPAYQQTGKPINQQTSLPANQHTNKPVYLQTSNIPLSTKQKQKYSTYLRPDSILDIQIQAKYARKKDHEFLQEIVDAYFESHKS